MNRKDYVRVSKKIIAVLIIFSMLQGYFNVLGNFGCVAYAAIESSLEDIEDFNDVQNYVENVVQEDDTEDVFEQTLTSEDEVVENVIYEIEDTENVEVDEVEENDDETITDEELDENEVFNPEIKILDSYRYLEGVIVRAEITNEISNLKHVLESLKVEISKPGMEGYSLEQVYIEELELASDDSIYNIYDNSNNFVIEVSGENSVLECRHTYTVVFVYKGTGEFSNMTFDLNAHLVYKDLILEAENISSEIEDDQNVEEEFSVVLNTFSEEEINNFVKEIDLQISKDIELEINTKVINDYSVSSLNSSIYKGYLYANAISESINETVFTSVYNVKLNSLDNIDSIIVTENVDEIVNKDKTRIDLSKYSEFTKSTINVENFDSVFGLEGYIEIVSEGTVIGKISNKNLIENESYVFYYPENISEVEFIFNNIENIGSIEIINTKVIKEDAGFSREQVIEFDKIKTEINVTEYSKINGENVILYQNNSEIEVNLEDTESRMDLLVSTDVLSTSMENEVTFTVTLRTDEEKYELFRNPVFEIKLPSDVSDVEINTVNLLYKNGLTIDQCEVVDNGLGNKVIRVSLSGTQREYTPGLPSTGSTVVVYTTITLDRLTTNQESKYEFKYDNEVKNKISYEVEGKTYEEIPVQFVSKQGLLRALSLTNVNTLQSVISYDNESSELLVEENQASQLINYKGTIVNNFNTNLTDVVIIGKIPTPGAIDGNQNQLETTFDMVLNSPISTTGLVSQVYYSEDVNASKDDSSWVTDVSDLSKYKSFKIVIENEEVKQGESLEFSLNMSVPENLDYNNKAYATYTVYYGLNGQELIGTSTDKLLTEEKEMTIDDFAEEEIDKVATLSFTTVASQGGTTLTEQDTVFERQIVDYTVYVKNTSNVEATNVRIKADVHNANLYYKYIFESDEYDLTNMLTYYYYVEDTDNSKQYEEFIIDTLKPGETKSFTYQGVVDEINTNEEKEVYSTIQVSADEIEETTLETIRNKVKNTKVSLKLEWAFRQIVDDKDVTSGAGLKYRIYYKNISDDVLENQVVYFVMPNTVKYDGSSIEGAEDFEIEEIETSDGTILAIEVPKIEKGEELEFYIGAIANEFDTNKESISLQFLAYTYSEGEKITSNKYIHDCYQNKTEVEYSFVADKTQDTVLKNNDIVKYTLTIKNIGVVDCNSLSFVGNLPNGLIIKSVSYVKENEIISKEITNENRFVVTEDEFKVNEEIKLELVTEFQEEYLLFDQKTVEVQVSVNGGKAFDEFETNVISLDVENGKVTVDEEIVEDETEEDEEPKDEEPEINDSVEDDTTINDNEDNNNNDNEQTENEVTVENKVEINNTVTNENVVNNIITNNIVTNNTTNSTNNNSNTSNSSSSSNSSTSSSTTTTATTTKKTYRISGKAWLDKNKDGKYENGEQVLSDIKATVYSVNTDGKVENGTVKGTTKTSTDGTYVFAGLENGNYIVVFEYDTEMYSPTQYKAKNIATNINSDVITKQMAKTNAKVAMTDTLEITDSTLINIDIGLVLNNEFDLAINKYVSKAVVTNSKGTSETKFDKDELVKLEIQSKMFENSSVKIVYTIVVKNEGDIDGYVNEITDILPDGTTFVADENKGWYQDNNGKLVYTGLMGKTIKPGETREVTLVLHSDDNKVSTKQLVNTVELTGISNEKAQDDIDIENNISKVTLLIIPSTGKVISNTLKVIGLIAIIAIVVVIILNRDKLKKVYK